MAVVVPSIGTRQEAGCRPARENVRRTTIMGQTLAEKILAAHADRGDMRRSEFVVARGELVRANGITAPPMITQSRRMGATCAFDPDPVALVPDHFTHGEQTFSAVPSPPFLQRVIASGGLVPYVRERLNLGRGFPAR
jgi:homoaconitase/3-isopropylmalate dehydratase large subunit